MEMFFLSYVNDAGGCNDRRTKHGQEEPPHVQGQGQKPGGPHAQRAAAKRSYRFGRRPRGVTARPRSGAAAESARL